MAKSKNNSAAPGKAAEFQVLSRLMHDQDFYEPGDVVQLTPEAAAPLIAAGALAAPPADLAEASQS